MILQWIEHWTYPYQEHALPIKLKNLQRLNNKSTQTRTRKYKVEAYGFTIKLCSSEKKRFELLDTNV